jgi:hypothetical protein
MASKSEQYPNGLGPINVLGIRSNGGRGNGMVGYEFYWRDPIKGYQLIGVLPERRKSPNRITKESVLNWVKKYFGNNLNLNDVFFIEVVINGESIRPL